MTAQPMLNNTSFRALSSRYLQNDNEELDLPSKANEPSVKPVLQRQKPKFNRVRPGLIIVSPNTKKIDELMGAYQTSPRRIISNSNTESKTNITKGAYRTNTIDHYTRRDSASLIA